MAIAVGDVRTDEMKRRHIRLGNFHPTDTCELCRRPIGQKPVLVNLDHERYEFVTDAEAQQRGVSVSLFAVGPDCARRIKRTLEAAGGTE